MRRLLALLVVLLTVSLPGPVRAADLSGVWQIDQAAWSEQVDRMVAAMMAQMPPEVVAQIKAQGADLSAAMKEAAGSFSEGTIEFRPDGTVLTSTTEEGTTQDARWQLDGDTLRIEVDDADGLSAMVGSVEGDRILLRPVLERDADADMAFLRDLEFPLVRRRPPGNGAKKRPSLAGRPSVTAGNNGIAPPGQRPSTRFVPARLKLFFIRFGPASGTAKKDGRPFRVGRQSLRGTMDCSTLTSPQPGRPFHPARRFF